MTDRRILSTASAAFQQSASGSSVPDLVWVTVGLIVDTPAYPVGSDGLLLTGARGFLQYPSSISPVVLTLTDITHNTPLMSLTFPINDNTPKTVSAPVTALPNSLLVVVRTTPVYVLDAWGMTFIAEVS